MLGGGLPGRLTLQRNQRLTGDVWGRGTPPYGPERPEVAGSRPAAVANTSLRLDAVQLGDAHSDLQGTHTGWSVQGKTGLVVSTVADDSGHKRSGLALWPTAPQEAAAGGRGCFGVP